MAEDLMKYTRRNLSSRFAFSLSVTLQLIILNVLAFIVFKIVLAFNPQALVYIALQPSNFFHGKYLWTLITSMFMHAGLLHLFFNMFSLFFVGSFVERLIGGKRFIKFYLASGLFAGLFFVSLSYFFGINLIGMKIFGDPSIAGVGASGAIYGLLGFLAIITPLAKVYLIVGPLIAIVIQAVLENFVKSATLLTVLAIVINIYILVSLFVLFSFKSKLRKIALPVELPFWILPMVAIVPLIIIGLFVALPIANTAHLGGLIAGLIYGVYIRKKYKRKSALISKYFS